MASFGLTGGIASGKTTVAAIFRGLGAGIIDADEIAHQLLRPGSPVFPKVVARFGTSILNATGEIDRPRLGAIVFSDPGERAALNAIIHPAILSRRLELLVAYHAVNPAAVVISDAALIYEAHIEARFLKVIVAWCRPEQQLERLMAKTGLTRDQAERRIQAQLPIEEKRRRADYVIDNSGSVDETRRQVEALYGELARLATNEDRPARSE
jgi:dephospho-CoA kinase